MTTKLNRTGQKRVARITDALKAIPKLVAAIDENMIVTLAKRSSISTEPDGYPSNSMPGYSRGKSSNTPVEGAWLARMKPVRDESSYRLSQIESNLNNAIQELVYVQEALSYVFVSEESLKGRQTSSACLICNASAQQAGFCLTDLTEWQAHGQPDRHRWILYRTEAMTDNRDEDPQLLVPDCPPPSPGHTALIGPYSEGFAEMLDTV